MKAVMPTPYCPPLSPSSCPSRRRILLSSLFLSFSLFSFLFSFGVSVCLHSTRVRRRASTPPFSYFPSDCFAPLTSFFSAFLRFQSRFYVSWGVIRRILGYTGARPNANDIVQETLGNIREYSSFLLFFFFLKKKTKKMKMLFEHTRRSFFFFFPFKRIFNFSYSRKFL